MARSSRDADPARKSRSSSPKNPRTGAEREQSAHEGGLSREDQEDREHRAFHARLRARQAGPEDGQSGSRSARR
jgi:hypothetical protein